MYLSGFFAEGQVIEAYTPEFLKEIFGSEDDDFDGLDLNLLRTTTLTPTSAGVSHPATPGSAPMPLISSLKSASTKSSVSK